jgi:GAF domain-containing protein
MSQPSDRHASGLQRLLAVLADSPGVDTFLDEVATLAAEIVTPAAACGITIYQHGQPVTVATSDPLAAQVDEIQYGADEGPCLDTLRFGKTVEVTNLAADPRWPRYRPHAIAHGIASSLSLPLSVNGDVVAALNLYGGRRDAFTDGERHHAETFAAQAAAALALLLRQARQSELHQQLQQAMASRSTIDQAIGILMAQQRCDAATAFDLLRRASQNRNRKLRDVAAEIITAVSGGPPAPPPDFMTERP